jgi:hypothetical protein
MVDSITIDKIFLELCEAIKKSSDFFPIYFVDKPDPLWNFYDLLSEDKPLTKSQANFVIKILKQYKSQVESLDYDLDEILKNPIWRHPFRVLDQTRKISVEQDDQGVIWYCFQFPYSFKEIFDATFDLQYAKSNLSKWEPDRKLRKINLYYLNFLAVDDFVKQHNFMIDESYLDAKSQIEEVLNFQESVNKTSHIHDEKVILKNSAAETYDYFNSNRSDIVHRDLLLAKKLGHLFETPNPENIFEKISSQESNHFWSRDITTFFDIYKNLQGKACVILDQQIDYRKWVNDFVNLADNNFISRKKIKVCFREDKNSEFNKWVKDNDIGGKIADGEIYIFLNAPAKWLYEDLDSVSIVVMTDIIPNTNKYVQYLIAHHPLVICLNEKKPTSLREIKIVDL